MSFTFASRQRTLRRICALTLAGAMLLPATPLLAVNAHADSGVAVAAEQNQSTGNITWGIKTSFRNYIGEPYKVSEGASYNSTDLFTFPNQEAKVSEDGNQVSLQGSGKVQYISHCADRNKPEECSLNLTLSNPRIEMDAAQGTGTLYMVVRTKNYTSGQWEGPHEIPMAKLSLKTAQQSEKDGVVTWSNVAANLTAEGNHAFSNFYEDGVGLDALTFSYSGTQAKDAQNSGYKLGESLNSGTDINNPQNTVRAGSYLFYAAGKSFGGGADARYAVIDPKTLQQTESATLPMGSSAHFAANPATGDIVFVNANTRALERYRVDESGKLVSQGTFAGVTFSESENILALGYNEATNSWAVLTADSSGQARYVNVASDGTVKAQTVKSPLDFDPSVAHADDLSEYYGDVFTGSTRTLAPLPDGSFLYSPNKSVYNEEGNKIQNGQLLHLSAQGISVVEQTQPKDAEEAPSLNGLLTTPDGYVYRWNNYAASASAVQVLKYDGSSFTTVRESSTAPHGMGAIASFFTAGDKIVAVDSANGRLVWMSKTLEFDHDVPLSDLRSTDKSGSYNALELPNGDIIFPTMVEKNDGLESNLWLNRLVNTAKTPAPPEQPKPADPTPEPTPEPTQPTPEPSKPAETPTPEPSESSEAPAPEPSKPADPAPTPEPSKSADPAPTAPAPEPSKPTELEPSKPAEPEPSKPAEPAQSFSDVHEGDMFYREITWLAGQNITTGWVDGTFRPHESIEREAIAAFFYRMSGSPEVQLPKESPFTDVKEGDPFYKEIVWFQQQGITTGWPDKTFRPHDPVSREAMAAFFYRYSGKPPVEVQNAPFKDVPEQNMFYREIAWLHDSKITTGWDDGTFRPHESISREAMAAFLYRYAHRG